MAITPALSSELLRPEILHSGLIGLPTAGKGIISPPLSMGFERKTGKNGFIAGCHFSEFTG